MREIKFRAWSPYWKPAFTADDRPEPAMEYFKLEDLSGGYTPNADIGVTEVDVVVMQYTGLQDKNGVEIYEGDIIEYPAWVRPKNSHKQTRATVIWHIDGYAGKIKGDWAAHSITGDWQKSKVIGNIYEEGK